MSAVSIDWLLLFLGVSESVSPLICNDSAVLMNVDSASFLTFTSPQ